MPTNSAIRVLIADDAAFIRESVALLLERSQQFEIVAQAVNGAEAVTLYDQYQPDVVVMDLKMPVMNGIAATSAILHKHPNARILIFTTFEGEENIYQALQAGAKGYLLKEASSSEVQQALQTIQEGQTYLPPSMSSQLAERLRHPALTPRELEVLEAIASGKSNQEIAEALFIVEGTVKSHINSILSKLGVTDRTQAVTTAIKRGLIELK